MVAQLIIKITITQWNLRISDKRLNLPLTIVCVVVYNSLVWPDLKIAEPHEQTLGRFYICLFANNEIELHIKFNPW